MNTVETCVGSSQVAEIEPIVQLWMMRMLVPLGGHREFIGRHGFDNDGLATLLGMGSMVEDAADDFGESFEPRKALTALRKLYTRAEKSLAGARPPVQLVRNVERLAKLVGLNETDCRILELTVLLHNEPRFDNVSMWLGDLSSERVVTVLSRLLELPENEIRASLTERSHLAQSGLVKLERSGSMNLRAKLDILSSDFSDAIMSSEDDPIHLIRGTVSLATPAELSLADYAHIADSLSVLKPYLQKVIESGRRGVNILIYGKTGTGKSQLAKVLAQEVSCELFEVATENGSGKPIEGEPRLRAYQTAQTFFSSRRALIVFDEVEDVFDSEVSFFGHKSVAQTRKGYVNRALEENSVPTLWLSNSIDGFDEAFVRRFDMVFEMPVPPKKQRERILLENCSEMLDAVSVARIAESESLSPAVALRAVSVVSAIREQFDPAGASRAVEMLISNTLEAQGHRPIRKNDSTRLPEIYDPQFIHADAELASIAQGLAVSKAGRLCLYGPPGTGKTAYARWLAEQIGVPLLVKRASDLLSKYVGGTEQSISSAFKQAEQAGAVLLIDEVDSFLTDRRNITHSWQISMVNEMLTQMESFSGVFIASTNLMQGLDQASLRRFDLKVKFDFLKPQQGWALFKRQCEALSLDTLDPDLKASVQSMQKLTPGDFASVIRQSRFRPITSAAELLFALESEQIVKENVKSSIGFLH